MENIRVLTKLWGIGDKTATRLIDNGIRTIGDVARMNGQEMAVVCKRPEGELEISRFIAKTFNQDYVARATENTIEIAEECDGIGIDLGLYLNARGIYCHDDIKAMRDIAEKPEDALLIKPDMPKRLQSQLIKGLNLYPQRPIDIPIHIPDLPIEVPDIVEPPTKPPIKPAKCDGIVFEYPPNSKYPHPDKGYYGFDPSRGWATDGIGLAHIMYNREDSELILDLGTQGITTAMSSWGSWKMQLVMFIYAWLIEDYIKEGLSILMLDEDGNLWLWLSKPFRDWWRDNWMTLAAAMLVTPDLAIATFAAKFNEIGYLKWADSFAFDRINRGSLCG